MPIYVYLCRKCKNKFDYFMRLSDKEAGKIPNCPKCGSSEVVQVIGNIAIMGKGLFKKSNSPGSCSPAAGPGCCG